MEYEKIFEFFYNNEVRYVICGGLAVNIYGIPRMTADIDLIIDFSAENISRFEKCMKKAGYFPSIPFPFKDMESEVKRNNLAKEKNMPVYSFYNSRTGQVTIDILMQVPLTFEELWDDRETRTVDSVDVYLASIEHLIRLKEYAGRPQDKSDILLLSKLPGKNKK
ncbi:MAG: nucleotidyltransferase family protein [Bacteroidota bacterium]|nr:nucleotidyltransferase family protein [Bacteroidota bacterium]